MPNYPHKDPLTRLPDTEQRSRYWLRRASITFGTAASRRSQ